MYPVLIAEVKNQGTNVLRAQEGLPKQAKGNAIWQDGVMAGWQKELALAACDLAISPSSHRTLWK